ncbi:hypothetical protein [Gynurincola endophyticus]|uniref:hypothetical protein n=1 Tax=Gynurincola endophyticus TaxID=2479004 RepID=UPI000F8F1B7B|nr:hypothetical protein [Gynurincola endophyticus]
MKQSGSVKVDKSVKPIHYKLRTAPKLEIGGNYFVSFGSHKAIPCILKEIHTDTPQLRVSVEMSDGVSYLYADELGLTPEEAVINEVTS